MIIGIDHGYYAIKTKQVCFPTGLMRYTYEPYTMQNVLQYGGAYYVCGTGRQTLVKDKTANDNYYLLTLAALAQEIRKFLVEKISKTGGHLASNLGVVELTMAMHLVFDLPKDKIIWDVGHQSYTHKILTGRKDGFDDLRKYGGMSGFPKRKESACDAFDTGHSSTSISAGLGMCAQEICRGKITV